jgi:hypothetical protein
MHADHDFRQRSRLLARRGNPVGDATPALGVTPGKREKFIQVKPTSRGVHAPLAHRLGARRRLLTRSGRREHHGDMPSVLLKRPERQHPRDIGPGQRPRAGTDPVRGLAVAELSTTPPDVDTPSGDHESVVRHLIDLTPLTWTDRFA